MKKGEQGGYKMKSFKYVVTDPVGIHARPAGNLVREIKKYASECSMSGNGKTVDGKKLMMVMTLGIKEGDEVELAFTGDDEDKAAADIETWMKGNL